MATKKKAPKATKEVAVKKVRKGYPSYDERIAAAEKKITALEELISDRTALVAKTQKLLDSRQTALARSEEALVKTRAKLEGLNARKARQAAGKPTKLTPEERAEKRKAALARAREAKKAQKAKLESLANAISDKGVSIDELLAQINK